VGPGKAVEQKKDHDDGPHAAEQFLGLAESLDLRGIALGLPFLVLSGGRQLGVPSPFRGVLDLNLLPFSKWFSIIIFSGVGVKAKKCSVKKCSVVGRFD